MSPSATGVRLAAGWPRGREGGEPLKLTRMIAPLRPVCRKIACMSSPCAILASTLGDIALGFARTDSKWTVSRMNTPGWPKFKTRRRLG